jgi:hypothetical protein
LCLSLVVVWLLLLLPMRKLLWLSLVVVWLLLLPMRKLLWLSLVVVLVLSGTLHHQSLRLTPS